MRGASNEERSFARLLVARNELRFAIQLHNPEITDYKSLLDGSSAIPFPLRREVQTYQDAIVAHGNQVMNWVRTQDESSIQLLEQAKYEKTQSTANAFLWQEREEVLNGRVKLIKEHVVQHFDTFFNTYHTAMDSEFETTRRELFPGRFEKGFLNAIVRHIVFGLGGCVWQPRY